MRGFGAPAGVRGAFMLAVVVSWLSGTGAAQAQRRCFAGGPCPVPSKESKDSFSLGAGSHIELHLDAVDPRHEKAPPDKAHYTPKKPALKEVVPTREAAPDPRMEQKPSPRQSWDGLPTVGPTRLLPEDLLDIPGQYIVDFNGAALAAAGIDLTTVPTADLARRLGVESAQIRSIQRRFMRSAVLRVDAQQAVALAANPLIGAVHADTKIKAAGSSTPPLSWGLDRLDSPQRPLDGKFDRESGAYAARVYLFDSEVANVAKELDARHVLGARFLATADEQQELCDGHGSQMASLIGGRTTGSAPRAQIVSLVVLPCHSAKTGDGASLVEAAEWLLEREAVLKDSKPVIANMSLAGKWSRKLNSVVEILTEKDVAVVASAGNNSDDACRYSPASSKDAITVGSIGPDDEIATSSNFGECVKVHAPGERITALNGDARGKYVAVNGTSGAAALVSGLLARSLERSGPAAARDYVLNAALPTRLWTKKEGNVPLAQISPGWRSFCRLAQKGHRGSITLHKSPGGKAIDSLAPDTLVLAERKSNAWIFVRLARGGAGWIPSGDRESRPLLRSYDEEPCPLPP